MNPVEPDLLNKINYLAGQLNKENKWWGHWHKATGKPFQYTQAEINRAGNKRDECEENMKGIFDKLKTALQIAEKQFNEAI